MSDDTHITVRGLTLGYGDFVVMRELTFSVCRGAIFFVMGASGSGKSTVMRALLGLHAPSAGTIFYDGDDFLAQDDAHRELTLRRFGVLYQSGALFSSMTVAENIGLPLGEYTDLSPDEVNEVASVKLALVGLAGFEGFYPGQLSGGMQKRAALARAMALDPEILPEYLVRPELATRSETNQLQIADNDRWGEPLKDGFSRTLRDDLEHELGAGHVVAPPFDPAHRPPRILDVTVRRFERVLPDGVELAATWTLRDGASGAVLATEQAHLREAVAGSDPHATVAALSKVLAALAAQVAAAVRARS